jgi:hypothetical protein
MDEQEGSTGADRDAQTRFVAKVKIRYGSASPDSRTAQRSTGGAVAREQTVLSFAPGGPPAPCIRLDALISTRSLILRFAVTREGWLHSHTSVFTRFISMCDAVPLCAAARLHIRNSSPHHIHHNPSLFLCMEARTSADASARLATTFSVYIPPERFVHLY